MIVRRYVVKDMPEAVASIRRELGQDAVILSTRNIRVRKWLGLRSERRIEVMAAAKEELAATAGASFGQALRMAMLGSAGERSSAPPAREVWSQLASEIAEIKQMLAEVKQRGDAPSGGDHEPLQRWRTFLQAEGVDAVLADRWARMALGHPVAPGDRPALAAALIEAIQSDLGALALPAPIRRDSRMVAFVGPTGVGKTTTIAKIAALHVLAGKRRVGLLTTDTFRIAAVEQLKTYADILNVPIAIADEPEDVPSALAALSSCDLVLVDTAGRNFLNPASIEQTKRMLAPIEADEVLLVVSLATKPADALKIADMAKPLSVDKFIFTKLDETSSVGMIPSLVAMCQLPIAYVTTGQNVPDDIDILSVSDLLTPWREAHGHG
ncbi:flagellar biosynthesis protein FlhF [Alicyclobacillus acidocaldarius]|uniref:Flagellar biosynthesis protein FlhF n=1 Tax=Alicyclobacillus acidocaldarius (strain Tc-4-1) TaxID=1048834 RepID=F8IHZ5_ALIAT|nr:flagellar biosynthesis protein FlhF [Alicyclobacillus acidocaldarius]AEJ43285.1 flagellar biosynthetic protein FlhF [Alicyclobacillus acidocaldarius subsp. acidocaldarius Tc-4-1]